MIEKEHVIQVLGETSRALRDGDTMHLRDLSNQTIHSATYGQDSLNIAIAVIIYSLGKILEKGEYQKDKGWNKFYKKSVLAIDGAHDALVKNDVKDCKNNLRLVREQIEELSGKMKTFVEDVFRKAKINKASKIYEHGISMEKTAKLLGVSLWDLAGYSGQKGVVADEPESKTANVKDRIKLVEEFFG